MVAEVHRNEQSGPRAVDRGEDLGQEASPRIQEVFTAALGHHQAGRRNRLAAAFRAGGLDPDAHLREMPWLPREQFAGFLDEIDVIAALRAQESRDSRQRAIRRESIRRAATHADANRAAVNAFEQALIDALLSFHVLYSRALLHAAKANL
jgi:hypothetical protein